MSDDAAKNNPSLAGPSRWIAALHVFVLTEFAISQPILDALGNRPIFIVDTGIQPPGLIVFAAMVCLLIPAVFSLLGWAAGLAGERKHRIVHAVLVCVLFAMITVPAIRSLRFVNGLVIYPFALALGYAFWRAYCRWDTLRSLVTFASLGIVVFPWMFFFHSPVGGLLAGVDQKQQPKVDVKNPVPVVVIIFDEFCGTTLLNKDRELNAEFFPNFAKLAQEATWYRNATGVHLRTDNAVPSILTGKYPRQARPTVTEHPVNLFTVLQASKAYEPVVFEPFTRLFPREYDRLSQPPHSFTKQMQQLWNCMPLVYSKLLIPPDFPFQTPMLPAEWFGLKPHAELLLDEPNKTLGLFRLSWASEREHQFERFLRCITPAEKPRIYFNHVVLPHFPWYYLPSGRHYASDDGTEWNPLGTIQLAWEPVAETWQNDAWVVEQAYQRYILQAGFVDHLIGRLVARLKEVGIYDDCILVITGDHGVSFHPNQSRRAPRPENIADVMPVPLFIKFPNQKTGQATDRNVETIDILPTIFDVLDVSLPLEADGHSLLESPDRDRPRKYFMDENGRLEKPAAFEERFETLDRMQRLFGPDIDSGLYRIGPRPDLLGKPVASFDIENDSDWQLELDRTIFDRPAGSQFVPCFIKGRIVNFPPDSKPLDMAIAVNGTIQGTTRTYIWHDAEDRFSVLLPEDAFRDGSNDVQIYIVGSQSPPTLYATRYTILPETDSWARKIRRM